MKAVIERHAPRGRGMEKSELERARVKLSPTKATDIDGESEAL